MVDKLMSRAKGLQQREAKSMANTNGGIILYMNDVCLCLIGLILDIEC